jgi:hypothetical protein
MSAIDRADSHCHSVSLRAEGCAVALDQANLLYHCPLAGRGRVIPASFSRLFVSS